MERRKFLQVLGLSPLAAKAAADEAIGKAAGLGQIEGFGAPEIGYGPAALPDNNWKQRVLRWALNPKFPSWFEEELRERYRHVTYLDPDLAAKKSWSMSVKLSEQRLRNIKRAKKSAVSGGQRHIDREEFQREYGIWL